MTNIVLLERETTHAIIGAFFEVYRSLGFGFLEHVYALAMECELTDRGHRVSREASIPVYYKGKLLTRQRADMIVDEEVVVEIKSTEVLPPMARRQAVNYLKATPLEVALILHFGPEPVSHRVVDSKKNAIRGSQRGSRTSRPRRTAEIRDSVGHNGLTQMNHPPSA